jgi:CubicO group peptidase (beta-lactamase class C family)
MNGFMMRRPDALLTTALILAAATGCARREYFPSDGDAAARLPEYLTAVMESRPMPGLAVAVVKGHDIIFAEGYGVRALGESEPVTAATTFHTASVSKALVATATVRLAANGDIDLDAPITRYLPYFTLADGREGEITVRHLLSHTSGLPDVEDYGWDAPEFDDGALERYVRSLASEQLLFEPGTQWKYSNMAFEVLGDMLAKVGGRSFEEVVQSIVLEPTGMIRSSFLRVENEDWAAPHRGALAPTRGDLYPYNRAHAPSSTLQSNVLDLSRFLAALLEDDEGGHAILPDDQKTQMWRQHASVERGIGMGLGWFTRSHRRSRMVLTPGRDPGFNAVVALLPERGVAVVLLTNYDGQSSFELVELVDGVLDVGLGRRPTLPRTSIAIPIARVLEERGLDAAIAEYRRLRDTKDPRYRIGMSDLITLGHDLRQTGRVADAIAFYSLNASEHPDYFGSHSALARAYLEVGDTANAVDSYRTVLDLEPERYGCPESCYRDEELETLLSRQLGPP